MSKNDKSINCYALGYLMENYDEPDNVPFNLEEIERVYAKVSPDEEEEGAEQGKFWNVTLHVSLLARSAEEAEEKAKTMIHDHGDDSVNVNVYEQDTMRCDDDE